MPRPTVAAALATVLLAATPSVAAADFASDLASGPQYTSPVATRSLQIAAQFWHTDPCPTGETFTVARLSGELAGLAPLERVSRDHPCQAVLSPVVALRFPTAHPDYQDDIAECGVIVHLVGHQLGFDHDDDPSSIMFGGRQYAHSAAGLPTVMRCYRAFKPKSVSRKRDRRLNGDRAWAQYPTR